MAMASSRRVGRFACLSIAADRTDFVCLLAMVFRLCSGSLLQESSGLFFDIHL
jgi:hypothetical protein